MNERVALRNSLDSTVIFIRKSELSDSGDYEMELRVGDEVVTATIVVNIIGEFKFSLVFFRQIIYF